MTPGLRLAPVTTRGRRQALGIPARLMTVAPPIAGLSVASS